MSEERDAAGNVDADHPRAYHRRVSEQLDRAGNCLTACGRNVNYQQTMGSWDDVDCRGCLAKLPPGQLRLDLDRESDARAGIPNPNGLVVLFTDNANDAVWSAHHLTVEGWGALAITDPKIVAVVCDHALELWPAAMRGRPHFHGGPKKDAIRMIEATAAMRDEGGLPAEASLVFSQLLLNLAGHAGRAKAFEIIGAFLDASDLPKRS